MDYDSLSDEELIKAYQAKVGNTPDYDSMSDEELLAEFAKKQENKQATWGETAASALNDIGDLFSRGTLMAGAGLEELS